MDNLFQPMRIKNMDLANRFVRSATFDRSDEYGHVTPELVQNYSTLARGGVGLIVTGLTTVHLNGAVAPFQTSIADDAAIQSFKELTNAVHHRGAKIAMQLAHAGRNSAYTKDANDGPALAPSVIQEDPYFHATNYRALIEQEIWGIIEAFGDAGQRAKTAGFDAVQVHAAHAYLPSQFLSPFTNKRTDRWGGTLENRLRLHCEICHAIRRNVGEEFPILIKLGVQDGFSGGLELTEGKKAAYLLTQAGFDAIEVSQGLRGAVYAETEFRAGINSPNKEAYFRQWSKEVKECVDVPVMLVGGLRSMEVMADIVQNGEADFVSMSRPLIREPELINLWKTGTKRKAACISCNQCGEALRNGEAVHCVQLKRKKVSKCTE
jgi:2,4-dienoyl-CoA reductase-like NADH-dependent reductase (Old Yellow Enzyme family)